MEETFYILTLKEETKLYLESRISQRDKEGLISLEMLRNHSKQPSNHIPMP